MSQWAGLIVPMDAKLLLKKISNVLILLSVPILSFCQNQSFKIQSKDLTVAQVLKKISNETGQALNYRADDLSQDRFTFSIEGEYRDIAATVFPLLGFSYKEMDGVTILSKSDNKFVGQYQELIKIVDEDFIPLPYAHVSIDALGILDVSSIDGLVELKHLIADSDTIKFRYIGYEDTFMTLKEIKGNNKLVLLRPSSESISEIIITGKSIETVSLELIDPNDIPQASTVDQDALTIAQSIPGITNPSETFQDLIIRGGSPDQIQFQWNGIRILQASHFFGKISSFNPYMVDKLEISKDGYSAATQGTISGGLHIKSENRVDSIQSMIHLNTLFTNIGLSVPILDNLSAKLAFRQSLTNQFQSPLARSFQDQIFQFGRLVDEQILIDTFGLQDFVNLTSTVEFSDRQASVWYQPSPRLSMNFDLIQIENELEFRLNSDDTSIAERNLLRQTNQGVHISSEYFWGPNILSNILISRSHYDYTFREEPEQVDDNTSIRDQFNATSIDNLNLTNKFSFNDFSFNIGYEFNRWNSEVFFKNIFESPLEDFNNDASEQVVFVNFKPRFINKLHLDLGLRWSAYNKSLNGRKLWEPRIHAKYRISPNIQIHGHYGRYHQYLSRRNSFTSLQADNGFWFLADETQSDPFDFINIMESVHLGGGTDISLGSFNFSFDFYRKQIFNFFSSSFDLSIDENPFNVGDSDIFGIEFLGRYNYKKHKFYTTYEFTNETLFFDFVDAPVKNPFSQPHRIGLVYEYNWDLLSMVVQYNFANGRPFSDAREVIVENNSVSIAFDNILGSRAPDYHRIDLSMKSKSFGDKIKHHFGFQISNIADRRNIIKNQFFINLIKNPVELGLLEKAGISRSFNIFWEINVN